MEFVIVLHEGLSNMSWMFFLALGQAGLGRRRFGDAGLGRNSHD